MSELATPDPAFRGGWRVPVGSIVNDVMRDCDHCGHDISVLTVATADGPVVMAADIEDYADEDNTRCRNCKDA